MFVASKDGGFALLVIFICCAMMMYDAYKVVVSRDGRFVLPMFIACSVMMLSIEITPNNVYRLYRLLWQ